jgi:hypothetical protein
MANSTARIYFRHSFPTLVALFFVLWFSHRARAQSSSSANLLVSQPAGWSGPLIVATQTARTNDSSPVLAGDSIYLSWGITNSGSGRVGAGSNIVTSIFVDDAPRLKSTNVAPDLAGSIVSNRDILIGSLSAGSHQIRIEVDSANWISEANETDNSYERTVNVTAPPISRATATAQVVNGFVVGLNLIQKGYGYTTPPQVTITGGGGSGATATAQVENGVVTGFTISNPGSGYTSVPLVTIDFPQINLGAKAGISLGLSEDVDPQSSTVEFWINPRGAGPVLSVNMASENYYWNVHLADLKENGDLEISYDWEYYQYVHTGDSEELRTQTFRGARKVIGNIPFNQWTHIAIRYDADGDFTTGFINGVPSPNTLSGHRVAFINPFVINLGAGWVAGSVPNVIDADLDETRRWTEARPDALIAALFNKSINTTIPTLAANWTFDGSAPQGATLVEAQIPGLTRTNLVELANLAIGKAVVRENTGVTPGREGKSLFLDYLVRNNAVGSFPAGTTFVAEIYLDNVLQARTTNNTPSSAGSSVNINGVALGARTAGPHSLRIVVDPLNALGEADESDNVFVQSITVLPDAPANLIFAQPEGWTNATVIASQTGQTSDQPLVPGDPVFISWGMLNAGPGRAGAGTPGSYYKLVTSVFIDDVLKTTSTNIGPDLPGDPVITVRDVNIDGLSAGTHRLKLVLDSSNAIAETNESDNVFERTFQIAAPALSVAVAQAQVVNGFVVGLTLLDRGYGYLTPPTVTISGGQGSGATATAQVANGRVTGFTITNPGSGYTSIPQVTIASPAGFGLTLSLHPIAFPLPMPDAKFPLSRPSAYGEVISWGYNGDGQTNVPPGLTNIIAVSAGYDFSLALRDDLTVAAWGGNLHNQLSIPAPLSSVVRIAAGHSHALALKTDGTVQAWGDNGSGQATVPIAGISNIVAISAGELHSAVLRSDGTVLVWGDHAFGQTNTPPGLSNVVAISAGGFHTLALKNDGTVVAWGDFDHGITNVPPGLSNVVAIEGGDYHSVALRSDGTVVSWGLNDRGQTNVPAGLSGVIAIGAGGNHSFAVKMDGTIVTWGGNTYGQGASPPNLAGVLAMSGNFYHNMIVKSPDSNTPAPGRVNVTFEVIPGSSYQLESSIDLNVWTPAAGSFVAEANQITRQFFVDGGGRYFRLKSL